jgi:hypothetical protein
VPNRVGGDLGQSALPKKGGLAIHRNDLAIHNKTGRQKRP